ncbi:ABC transporter ATP-binding protein [Acidiferrimicrobium sp. IK]|uniref:ABC transporter ATP-binding protein n=1 Tax=Acidiferrimicrobium sp. IK TaxID=2871700 RepID=UPI0021CB0440|nr:ABC transporter ATP-binding protein [Acidiferrimicrobium sp. IK]MCU4185237.1 ABC transporter ATP-binding protein [Acidiferrimicrobium sp. IK]
MVAVVGASGSGKSSMLAVAGAMRQPDSGRIHVGGISLTDAAASKRCHLRHDLVGFVFQGSNLLASLTALEQLELVGRIGRAPRAATRRKALALLGEVGLAAKAERRPGQLSGGERQRVGIARALMADPAVLLVDEPTSALDHQRAIDIVGLLVEETHRHQIATLMVTHDRSLAGLADRVIEMRDGRLAPAAVPER